VSDLERLLTARELAEQLGVSSEAVLRWTRRGELRGIRLPSGAIRYRPAELEAWLDDRVTEKGRGEELTPASTTLARGVTYAPPASTTKEEQDAR
jgi:excisionase family DNA binding protein